jgi:alpha-amylase
MFITNLVLIISLFLGLLSPENPKEKKHFDWNNATVYFMLTDRFNNGDPSNDVNFGRTTENTKQLRSFVGGDLKGITQKIEEGYFNKLGVDAIWFSPVNEQIHGSVDEGQGNTFAFHGYWIRDWTAIEPNWGTAEDLAELMKAAHGKNIRVLMDVIINHTGPVTEKDPVWPADWVRTEPQCSYQGYESTVFCTLVKNLPDIRTDQEEEVELPKTLMEKWEKEGRLQKEMDELDAFFARTGYPRTPRYYIIKWITDYIRKYGIDGFRVDTVKHAEADVWADLAKEAKLAFEEWKKNNQEAIQEDQEFFMLAETYNYNAQNGKLFDFGDKKVDYFANGFDSQINFGFKGDAHKSYEELFSTYSNFLNGGELSDVTFMNYVSSHDDSWPFDKERQRTFESATKLLLCPGQAQIYYGDEIARPLIIEGAVGDVNLRSVMDWEDTSNQDLLFHWQKLGQFRQAHPSVGAGEHKMISEAPYFFVRSYVKGNYSDRVLVGLDLPKENISLNVSEYFDDGTLLRDFYSTFMYQVVDGEIEINAGNSIVLLGKMGINK